MQEETKIKVDSVPEKKTKKKETALKDMPKIETLEPRVDISYVKVEAPFQFVVDIIICLGGFYGFLQLCYFFLSFLSNLLSDFIAFLIPC